MTTLRIILCAAGLFIAVIGLGWINPGLAVAAIGGLLIYASGL